MIDGLASTHCAPALNGRDLPTNGAAHAESWWGRSLKWVLRSRAGAFLVRVMGHTPMRSLVFNSVYDPKTGVHVGSGNMQRDWDERSRTNAHYFINVDGATSEAQFWESG